MKRLLLRLALLGAPFAALLVYCEIRFAQTPASDIAAKHRLFHARRAEIETLVLGSSHTAFGIIPGSLGPNVFNAAALGQSLYYDWAIMTRHLSGMPALRCVVVPVSYHSLELEMDVVRRDKRRPFHYMHEWGIPHRNWRDNWDARNYSAYFLHRSEQPWQALFRRPLADARHSIDGWGGWIHSSRAPFRSPEAQTDHLQAAAAAFLRQTHSVMRPAAIADNVARLHDLAAELNGRHIRLVLLTTPVSRFYARGFEPAALRRRQVALETLRQLPGVTHLDHLCDPRFTDSDFHDLHHLNAAGAEKLTDFVREELAALPPLP